MNHCIGWRIEYSVEPSFDEGFVICIASGPGHDDDCHLWSQHGFWIELSRFEELCASAPRRIPCAEGHAIHAALQKARISAAPPPVAGLDGTTHTLCIGGLFNKATYRWWSYLPEGWADLSPIVGTLTKYAVDELRNIHERQTRSQ